MGNAFLPGKDDESVYYISAVKSLDGKLGGKIKYTLVKVDAVSDSKIQEFDPMGFGKRLASDYPEFAPAADRMKLGAIQEKVLNVLSKFSKKPSNVVEITSESTLKINGQNVGLFTSVTESQLGQLKIDAKKKARQNQDGGVVQRAGF